MPITVLMTQSRKGVAGADLLAGLEYSLPNDLAIQLVGQKYAVDVHGVIGRATNADEPIGLSVTPTQLAASATAGLPVEAGTLLRDPVSGQLYGQSDGAGGYAALGGTSSGLGATQTISTTGPGATIPTLGATRVSLTFSGLVGTVHQAQVQIEDAATGSIIGVVYWPSSGPRWFDLPVGTNSVRFNCTYWSDAGGTDTINLTVAG